MLHTTGYNQLIHYNSKTGRPHSRHRFDITDQSAKEILELIELTQTLNTVLLHILAQISKPLPCLCGNISGILKGAFIKLALIAPITHTC